jgi:hypothetical protein
MVTPQTQRISDDGVSVDSFSPRARAISMPAL